MSIKPIEVHKYMFQYNKRPLYSVVFVECFFNKSSTASSRSLEIGILVLLARDFKPSFSSILSVELTLSLVFSDNRAPPQYSYIFYYNIYI